MEQNPKKALEPSLQVFSDIQKSEKSLKKSNEKVKK